MVHAKMKECLFLALSLLLLGAAIERAYYFIMKEAA
jgi:hypothetical protein